MKILSAFRDNFFLNNFLIALCLTFFIIIAIDIGSELAVQKDEIGNIIGIIEECCTDIILSSDFLTNVERPLLFEIPLENLFPLENICNHSVNDRGPPEVNL